MEELENIRNQAESLLNAADDLIKKHKKLCGPKYGDKIYFLNKYFEVDYKEYTHDDIDASLQVAGNFFLTRDAAEIAAEAIYQALDHLNF